MARAGRTTLADAVYWSTMLRPRGIPLPAILHQDLEGNVTGFPALILERLPGTDLGHVYPDLTADEKRGIATEVARLQERVRALPAGRGFGFVARPDSACAEPSWGAVVHRSLDESEYHLRRLGWVEPSCVEPVRRQVAGIESCMDHIAPLPFLDDTTTKNVIIDRGHLSGIVDVDEICFGDRLFPVALTQMALLQADRDLDYIRFWCERLRLTTAEEDALRIYTSVFCVTFLSEIGRRFNRSGPPVVDQDHVDRLQRILADLRTNG